MKRFIFNFLFGRRALGLGALSESPAESYACRRERLQRERVIRAQILTKLNRRLEGPNHEC